MLSIITILQFFFSPSKEYEDFIHASLDNIHNNSSFKYLLISGEIMSFSLKGDI